MSSSASLLSHHGSRFGGSAGGWMGGAVLRGDLGRPVYHSRRLPVYLSPVDIRPERAAYSCRMPTRKDDDRVALLQGTLDLLILRTLLLGPRHGQGIARMIQQTSEEVFLVDHGSLYLALQRLEEKNW